MWGSLRLAPNIFRARLYRLSQARAHKSIRAQQYCWLSHQLASSSGSLSMMQMHAENGRACAWEAKSRRKLVEARYDFDAESRRTETWQQSLYMCIASRF